MGKYSRESRYNAHEEKKKRIRPVSPPKSEEAKKNFDRFNVRPK